MTDEHYYMIKRLAKCNLYKGSFDLSFITSLATKDREYKLSPAQIASLEKMKRRHHKQYYRVKL